MEGLFVCVTSVDVQLATLLRFGRIDQVRSRNLSARSQQAGPSVERSHGGSAVLADHEGQSSCRVSRLQIPREEDR